MLSSTSIALDAARHNQRQTFSRVFIDEFHQYSELPAPVMRLAADEVVAPDMVPVFCGRSRMHEPSLRNSLPRAFCFLGTLSPSRRQIRWTRSQPTCQPASLSSDLIRR